jgi:hypothetical protein
MNQETPDVEAAYELLKRGYEARDPESGPHFNYQTTAPESETMAEQRV